MRGKQQQQLLKIDIDNQNKRKKIIVKFEGFVSIYFYFPSGDPKWKFISAVHSFVRKIHSQFRYVIVRKLLNNAEITAQSMSIYFL